MGSGDPPSLPGRNHHGTFPASAHVDPLPRCLTKRRTPGLDAVPGTLAWASPAARHRGRGVPVTQRRVRRYRQQVTLTPHGQPTPQPRRTPPLVVTGPPALGQPGTVGAPQLPGQLVTRARGSVGVGNPGFVPAGGLLRPCCGQQKPLLHQGVARAGDVAHVQGHWTGVDCAQTTTPRPGHPDRLATRLGTPRGLAPQHPIAWSHGPRDLTAPCRAPGRIVPRIPAHTRVQGQTRVAQTLRNRCNVVPCKVRHQPTDRGCGVWRGDLTREDGATGRHTGGKPWDDLLEHLRCTLTFGQQWVCTNGVARFHGTLLL